MNPIRALESAQTAVKAAAAVGLFSLIVLGIVSLVHEGTAERIAANERRVLLLSLHELIPPSSYDNEIAAESLSVTDPLLGSERPLPMYRARRNGQTVAIALSAVAPDGYSGAIRLLVVVRADGTLAGARVITHRETPGLGDPIDRDKSDWILSFDGRSLRNPDESRWGVKKDGGHFDQFSGATITPRAVVAAVKRVLLYVRAHHTELFGAAGR